MRLGWLVSAGVCAWLVACSGGTHKNVLFCDSGICEPEAGAGGTPSETPPDTAGEGGTSNDVDAEAPAAGAPDAGPSEGGAAPDGGEPEAGTSDSKLQITLAGNGSVAVTDAAACLTGPCDYATNDGAVLTLEAKPGTDSHFVGWSGACSGSTPITTVTVSGLQQCTATFVVQRAVSVSVDPAGSGTVSTTPNLACGALGCSGEVDNGSSVTLLATPAAGYRFASWSGSAPCNGSTQSALALVVTADLACTAKFSKQFTLSVTSAGAVAPVSVTSGTCVAASCAADADGSASFTAGDLANYRFTGWSGDALCTGAKTPLQVTHIASDIACVANYAARFKVTGLVGSGLTGTVTATSGDVSATCSTNACIVDSGKSTTLVAPTIAGYRLTGWTGPGCTGAQSGNGLVVTPTTSDLTCTATYALGVSVTGTVVGATGSVVATSTSPGAACTSGSCGIDAGGSVSLTAPNLLPGYRFVNWTGDAGCSGAALTIALTNVTTSRACNANYVQQFTILAKANAGGTASAAVGGVNCAAGSCTVDAGTSVALTAVPDTANGYRFTAWSGTGCTPAANNPLTLSNVNTTCTASFALNTFTIAATSGTNGSVSATRNDTAAVCAGGSCTVNFGTTVTLAATPAAHYHFVSWTGAGCTPTTGASLILKNVNASCAAAFTSDTFAASVSAAPAAAATVGITCPAGNCAAVPYGQLVNVTAVANAGWSFSGWSANCNGGTASPNSVTITADTACVANFRPRVVGTVSPTGGGTITATGTPNAVCANGATASCTVDSGGSVTLVAVSAANAVFTSWTGDCAATTASVTVSPVNAPANCTANFSQLWAVTSGAVGEEVMTGVTALSDGTVLGVGTSQLAGSRLPRLGLVTLDANTGKLGRNQLFSDAKGTGSFVPLGIATTSNQKNIVTAGVHRAVAAAVSQYPWLHNEQAPAWEYEYSYSNAGTATLGGGNVIATKDGGYAFAAGVADANGGIMTHLTKVDTSGKPVFDLQFCAQDPKLNCLTTSAVDALEDPAGKYFAVLSSVQNTRNEILLTFINEDGTLAGSARYGDSAQSLYLARFALGTATDTFLVTGYRVDAKNAYDAFYVELPKASGKAVFAYTLGTDGSYEQFNAVTPTAKGFAFAGKITAIDANGGGSDDAWLVLTDGAGAISSQQAYGGTNNEEANAVFVAPSGGLVVGGTARTWGAGLGDMWTLRLDAAGAITFNAASAAKRYGTTFTRTALNTIGAVTSTLRTVAPTVTQVAPTETLTTAGFTQNAQAP